MIPSFADFQAAEKLKKYTFQEPTVVEKWGYFIMTQKVVGPRGGETYATRSYWNPATRDVCAGNLRKRLENVILTRLKK